MYKVKNFQNFVPIIIFQKKKLSWLKIDQPSYIGNADSEYRLIGGSAIKEILSFQIL